VPLKKTFGFLPSIIKMAPYSQKVLKRKYGGNYSKSNKRRTLVRKSYKTYPVYNNVTTAPAPTRVELKYDYGNIATFAVDSTPAVVLLTTIANGSGSSDRIGKRIQYHDIELSWMWLTNASHGYNAANFMIVYDNSPNGALPAYTDILDTSAVTSLTNPDTRGRFTILFRTNFTDTYVTTATQAVVAAQGAQYGHKVVKCKKTAQFIGTDATIASIEKGAIYLITNSYSDNVVALEFTNMIQYSDA